MKILYFCPLWGCEDMDFDHYCQTVAETGYDGVEMSLPLDDRPAMERRMRSLKAHGLELLAQHWETVAPNLDDHVAEYRRRLEWLASAEPLLINSQTGRDWFGFEDNCRVIAEAKAVAQATGIQILHETHRGKFSYAAAAARRFLECDADLRITADFSHWCAVSESLLEDQQDSIELAVSRADHIHARVGHPEGPQVSDPRAPEWAVALNAHLGWWDRIVEAHRKAGSERLTITPEFGPYPYMPQLPYTQQPVASQWEINLHMMSLLRSRYKAEA
ncbi:sugar phosphate isomerase/epimerase family protein [Pontiella sulfatireligans]|uniref:Xylose isomerase-like TIM barrel domain-containing protein n=1 Tax=Pontiella sulfatireligans TaxID=2750658 RepID=A0A6C2UNH4_9BACT|nr:TIM barrel protein [Pontiella sulfatireligans]VGO21738.1 hypothetical protein SCARR_03813 [Pontiella sulfatireligans]